VIGANPVLRSARITDRQALGELSRRVHASLDSHRRSLGVPAPTPQASRVRLSDFIPSWLPLRAPSVHLVAELDGRIVGSCRALEEPGRDDWVITELDAEDGAWAAEIRYGLLGALVDAGGGRDVTRFRAACADVRENLELFGQAGFTAYAQEEIWWRPPHPARRGGSWLRSMRAPVRAPRARRRSEAPSRAGADLQPAGAPDAWHLFDLWAHATPPAIARLEGYGAGDWNAVSHEAIVPRSSLNPLLEFSEVEAWVLPADQRAGAFAQHGASRAGPHYLRFLVRDGVDGAEFLEAVLARMGGAAAAGTLSPVRTYESAGTRAAEAAGFEPIGRVTLLVREVRAQVRQPVMVPAVR
jgi:hypothetical protein